MKTVLLTMSLIALAGPALALSCMRPDAVHLYEQARDSEDVYIAVRGRIDLSEPANNPLPESDTPTLTEAVFSGVSLTTHGFGAEFIGTIQVSAICFGPWCGNADGFEDEQIAFLKVNKHVDEFDTYTLDVDPCGGSAISWSKDGERRLLACHRDGKCVAAE